MDSNGAIEIVYSNNNNNNNNNNNIIIIIIKWEKKIKWSRGRREERRWRGREIFYFFLFTSFSDL